MNVRIDDGAAPGLARKLRAEASYAGFTALEGGASVRRTAPRGTNARGAPDDAPATIRVLSARRVQIYVQRATDSERLVLTLERRRTEGDSFALRVVEQLRARLVDVGWSIPVPAAPAPTRERDATAVGPARAGAASDTTARRSASTGAAVDVAPVDTSLVDPAVVVIAASTERDPATADARAADLRETEPGEASIRDDDTADGKMRPVRLWLEAGAAGSWSFGGLGAVPHAALGLRADLGESWSALLSARVPLLATEVTASEGEANVRWTSLGGALEHALPLPAPWFAGAGLGAAVVVLDARGESAAPFTGQEERLVCGAGFTQLSFGRTLADGLRLRATALGGLTAPRPVLQFDEREVASLGRVFGSLALALELSWPTSEGEPP